MRSGTNASGRSYSTEPGESRVRYLIRCQGATEIDPIGVRIEPMSATRAQIDAIQAQIASAGGQIGHRDRQLAEQYGGLSSRVTDAGIGIREAPFSSGPIRPQQVRGAQPAALLRAAKLEVSHGEATACYLWGTWAPASRPSRRLREHWAPSPLLGWRCRQRQWESGQGTESPSTRVFQRSSFKLSLR